ncbi:hypothetical protein HYU22_03460 [Candidatus Woesearchaeota archaeon]|nr:hypothetical protein [Candidatus Woesearchaeota archaeon]
MDLEIIINILVDNAKQFTGRERLDMSMFPEADVPRIYAAAAEGTLRHRDFDATSHYLFLGKQWARLLELGVQFFHSNAEEEQKAGKMFLEIVACHNKLPETTAVELADHILKHDGEYSRYRAVRALAAGKAAQRAEQVAYQFLEEGNLEDGTKFLKVTGKKLSLEEVTRFAGVALERGQYREAFELYQLHARSLPKERAKAIANANLNANGSWIFDQVVEYMDKRKNPFTAEEFKGFADAIFDAGGHAEALKLYERAGKAVSSDEYRAKGEQILGQVREIESSRSSYSLGSLWPTVSAAFAYLSRSDPQEAQHRVAQFANSLLDQPDFAKMSSNVDAFGLIYEMVSMPLPVDKALIAAQLSEKKGRYDQAAKFYVAARMKDAAKRMGELALKSDDNYQREYGAREAFKAAGDEVGLAAAKFLENNLRRH